MNKKITFTYGDVDYTLEYDRNTIKRMESAGLVIDDIGNKPMLYIDILFKGAFIKNHRNTKESVMEKIYKQFKDKEKLVESLIDMVTEQYTTLLSDDEDSGNISWEIVG